MNKFKQIILTLLICAAGISAWAYSFEKDGFYYNITSNSEPYTVEVTYKNSYYYSNYSGDVVIPESVTYNSKTYLVKSIGRRAFLGCISLTSVTIPNSVTTIGVVAFSDCTSLTSVTIPNSVTSIEEQAFYNCTRLATVNFNAPNCTSMGSGSSPVFSGCTALTIINIGNQVRIIPDYAFKGCTGLTSVTIPNSVTNIGEYAFGGCTGLNTIIALGTTPPSSETNAFSNISSVAVLFVPCGTKLSYFQQFNAFNMNNIYDDCNSYPVTINSTGSTGGEISVSATEAQLGNVVWVYATPNDGYSLSSIKAYNANNPSQTVPISLVGTKGRLTYSFVMMPFPVKVEATFVKGTTGIDEENGNIATSLYPNPTNGKVTIEAENLQRVSVFNLMGQKIMENTASGNSFECDMSRYGAGVYMMQIETEKGVVTRQVVKQ